MPSASVEHHDPIGNGPALTDFIVRVDEKELEALSEGAYGRADLAEFTHAAVWALILLRTLERDGTYADDIEEDRAHLRGLIRALEQTLLPRMLGIRDAAVRWHSKLDGSYGKLADAMDVARSTAQSRVEALLDREPSEGERWARNLGRRTGHKPRQTVTLDLTDPDTYFAVTSALGQWATWQRDQASDETAEDPEDTTAKSRLRWAAAADTTLERIEAAL